MDESDILLAPEQEALFSLIFVGGDADQQRLNLYDDAVSLRGFARTLAIIGHYYITGEIIAHAPKSKLKIYAAPSEEGSFKQNIIAAAIGGIISSPFNIFASRLIDNWIPPPNDDLKVIIKLLEEQNEVLKGEPKNGDVKQKKDQVTEAEEYIKENKNEMQAFRSITSNSFKDIFRPIGRSADAVVLSEGKHPRPFGAVDPTNLGSDRSGRVR